MRIVTALLALGASTVVAGCASTSFAPPSVNSAANLTNDDKCSGRTGSAIAARTVVGALDLIENYTIAYGCAARQLANGRQAFEVPSALALAGGAAAAAFGAGPDVAIATGAGASLFNHGNSYYAPKAKAHILSAAYNAVVCIKQEASGITAINVASSDPATNTVKARGLNDPAVSFSPSLQYYQMVSAALQNVHSILAERLSSVGSYSPDAIAKEIQQLAQEKSEADANATKDDATTKARSLGLTGNDETAFATGVVQLAKLQPRLKLCVLAAKAG